MRNQNLFEALERICGFTALETDMAEIIAAHEMDVHNWDRVKELTLQIEEIMSEMDEFIDDLEKYENSFVCGECGTKGMEEFIHEHTFDDRELWYCKKCKTKKLVGHEPDENDYH
jgi:formamidopyrimidine-DNA glycosylase